MEQKVQAFRDHVTQLAADPAFVHRKWFIEWHLKIVERIALELAEHYPEVDHHFISVLAWLHDYGKLLDYDRQYEHAMYGKGCDKLIELGFDEAFATKAADSIELMDKKMDVDLHGAPIEVQIISSADGCSHLAGPFMHLFWHEATDTTFTGKTFEELMELNRKQAMKDWERKIVLPEARAACEKYYQVTMAQSGALPKKFLTS